MKMVFRPEPNAPTAVRRAGGRTAAGLAAHFTASCRGELGPSSGYAVRPAVKRL